MAVRLLKLGILVLTLGLINHSLFAQEKSCDLQFGVYEFKEDGTSEQFPVNDSQITLIDEKSQKPIKLSNNKVSDLVEANYQVTVSKDGFQQTVKKFSHICEFADAQNTVSEIIFLWKGNSNQIIKMYFEKSSDVNRIEIETTQNEGKDKVVGLTTDQARTQPASPDTSPIIIDRSGDSPNPNNLKSGGVVNGKAIRLAKPKYPNAAKAVNASGAVVIEVFINELGNVVFARRVSGHPIFSAASTEAALQSKFRTTILQGIPVKVRGVIVYNFQP